MQLVARRESATMAVEMGATSGVADFRLIDPPTVPNKPAAPNRLLLMPAAGLAALLDGGCCQFPDQPDPPHLHGHQCACGR
jgi:uncharacterized protein involved in exopolysaccharide biosynthesis